MAKYDDASWHYGGEYPPDLNNTNAATHIGMFLTWCIDNDLISEELEEDAEEDIQLVKSRELTGAEFLINNCDEKFTTDDLNDSGNEFAADYYGIGKDQSSFALDYADYYTDYEGLFKNSDADEHFYKVENTWENYKLLTPILDKRFEEWKKYKTEK